MVKIRFRLLANRVIWGLLSLALVVAMLGKSNATQIGAQGLGPDRIFAVTRNSDSLTSSIWEINPTTGDARQILSLGYSHLGTPRSAFSENELSAFNLGIERGIIQGRTADDMGMIQNIRRVWLFEVNRLLAEISYEVCDRRPGGDCYGYFEFIEVDAITGDYTSLFQVDFHHSIAEQWEGCRPSVYVDTVLLNPTQEKLAFTLKPVDPCYPFPDASYGYLVDYSSHPVQQTPIPFADGISWSPDGNTLAYFTKEACHDSVCDTSIRVLTPSIGAVPVTLINSTLYDLTPLFTAWRDERTVLFQWRDTASSEAPLLLAWHDILDKSIVFDSMPQAFFPASVYYLNHEQSYLFGLSTPDRSLLAMPTEKAFAVDQSFPDIGRVFYNSRYDDFLITIDREIQNAVLIDANMGALSLPLSSLLASYPGEVITFVSPGALTSLNCTFAIAAGDVAGLISAIEAANVNPDPETICLATGSTYTLTAAHNTTSGGNGLPAITTDITIVGNGATITRDSAAAPFRLLFVDTMGNLTLEDVTLSNGLASLGEPGDDGGAIYSLGSLTLVDSTLTANTANADGGGILSDGTLTIEGTSRIEGNAAADDGGGIYAAGGTLTVTDATIAANSAGDQGGGIRSVTCSVTLTNASLTGNNASSASGGGLYATSTALTIHGGTISGNVANTGGGLYLTNSPSSAQIDGGVQIVNNSATSGGGLYLSEDGQAALTNVRVAGNQASSSSAGIRMGGILTITDSEISNNGSAMQPGSGGGIRASGALTIINSTLTGNQVSSSSGLGAGIYVADGGTVSVSGGEVSDNHAYRGGGFYVTGSLSLSTTVSENSATGHGGGLYVSTGTATADYCTFTGNTSLVTGGGIYNNALLQAANTIFSGNSAQDRAGAVYAGSVVDSWVHSSCISGNTSPNTGGVYSGPTGFNATNNWWGAADGPSGAGSGSGDAVNNRVVVTPFLTTGCPAGAGAQTEQGIMTLRAPVPMSVTSKALEPQQLPIETAFEDETGWRATGTWLLDTLSGHNAAPSWAANTVPRDQTSILELLAPVELGRARSPRLTFWQRGQIAASDMVMVEVLPEDETDWVVIDRQTSLPTDWTPRKVDLSAYRGQTVQLRVRVVAGGELSVGDRTLGLWLDDLSITSR